MRRGGPTVFPPRLDVYVPNVLSVKSFHGALAENTHGCSLRSRIGKARIFHPH